MIHIIECAPIARRLRTILDRQESVLLHAPRYYGKRFLLDEIARDYAPAVDAICIELSTERCGPSNQIDLPLLWELTAHQLGTRSKAVVREIPDYIWAFVAALKRSKRRIIVLIRGEGRWNEENHFGIVAAFNQILELVKECRGKLRVVAIDDYSMFYSRKKSFESSLAYLTKIHCAPLTQEDIFGCITGLANQDGVELHTTLASGLAERVEQVTGGHPGLVDVLLKHFSEKSWGLGVDAEMGLDRLLRYSHVIQGLNRMIEDDLTGNSHTALEYIEPRPREAGSPRVHYLIQLGILQWAPASMLRLCPGAIRAMMEETNAQAGRASHRLGAMTSATGEVVFEAGNVEPTSDDFVVVHISDLHISRQNYRFRMSWPEVELNLSFPTATELLVHDLRRLQLIGRVDALVLSGDIVDRGTAEEYYRAEEEILRLLRKIEVPPDRLSLVAGNHDILWPTPDGPNKKISREPYEHFLRPFGRIDAEANLLTVTSRSNNHRLRIIELDSNRVEGPEAGGIGFVSGDAIDEANRLLGENDVQNDQNVYIWMVLHHHIFPATPLPEEDARKAKVSVMGNSTQILDFANRAKVELILHGHEHQPSVTVARRWPISNGEQFRPIASIGAGSFSAALKLLGPFTRNHYYIIYRRRDETIIRSRMLGDDGLTFTTHRDITLPRGYL